MSEFQTIIEEAWRIREFRAQRIYFSAPGAKHYENRYYANHRFSFVNLSVTGRACSCRCAHCGGKLLETMIPAPTPGEMRRVIDQLKKKECRGILVSGGADSRGEVPLLPFAEALAYAKQQGMRVLVHSGLIGRETAVGLKKAGVDQVLLDVIGDESTIREVYHLDRKPQDYFKALLTCREAGLETAPHLVIGLHYGRIRGELQALKMIKKASPQVLVLVILTPMRGTEMAGAEPPPAEEAAQVIGMARILNPSIPLSLGCARPGGEYKRKIEKLAVDCGVDGIAFPAETTVEYAVRKGLQPVYSEECCGLSFDI